MSPDQRLILIGASNLQKSHKAVFPLPLMIYPSARDCKLTSLDFAQVLPLTGVHK